MNKFWTALAKLVVPFLIQEAVKHTDTKADDKLLKAVKVGFEHKFQ